MTWLALVAALWVAVPTAYAGKRVTCGTNLQQLADRSKKAGEHRLKTEAKIANDIANVSRSTTWKPHYEEDLKVPALLWIESATTPIQYEHEIRTARDYAQYLKNSSENLRFVFVPSYHGRHIPLFDGYILDEKTGEPIVNVSMKHADGEEKIPDEKHLHKRIWNKLRKLHNAAVESSPLKWFLTTNPSGKASRAVDEPFYKDFVINTRSLMDIFKVQSTGGFAADRELRTLLDLRESGYTWHYLTAEHNLRMYEDAIQKAQGNQSFVILLDSEHVIEVSKSGIKISNPTPAIDEALDLPEN